MKSQRHKYEYKVSPNTAAAKVVRMVGAGRRVLELGPGPGAITRLLKDNACLITALEVDPKAIEIVGQYCEQIHSCDLNDPDWPSKLPAGSTFDAIVAADVLEHLYDPWSTLRRLHALLDPEGFLVISLPHVAHGAIVASLLAEEFEYQPWGLLDKTHIRFFGLRNMQRLFNDAGFKIVEADFVVKAPEQTEFAKHWRRLPPESLQALSANPFSTVYQVVIRAVPLGAEGGSLQLISLPVPSPTEASYSIGARGNRIAGFALSFLSLQTRQKILRLIERTGIRL
jgi:2-polyprenyl-3-methyl-5-hydroxy-6-metoxy-1,4-benzoquinol methylase